MVSACSDSLALIMKENESLLPYLLVGKLLMLSFPSCLVEREVQITSYDPPSENLSQRVQPGNSVEVRGVCKGASEVQFSDLNRFEGDFDMGTYEQMLDYYHGMCSHLCVQEVA